MKMPNIKMPKMDKVNLLKRGDMVVATRDIDPKGAQVYKGMIGVVFETTNAYSDGCGPMVRWVNGGACNVYDSNVRRVESKKNIGTFIRLTPTSIAKLSLNYRIDFI